MLVLSRKVGEKIMVPECGMTITVLRVRGNRVRLGLCAPTGVNIQREEILPQHTMATEAERPRKGTNAATVLKPLGAHPAGQVAT